MSMTKICRSVALALTLGLTFPAMAMDAPTRTNDPTLPQRAQPDPNKVQAAASTAPGAVKAPAAPTAAFTEFLTKRGRDQ